MRSARLFVAIGLDEGVRVAIAAEQQRVALRLGDAPGRLRWIQPDQMHMTVVFIGAVAGDDVGRVVGALDRPVERPAFHLGFGTLGMFPPRGAPRVLWLGVNEGECPLKELHALVMSRLGATGVAFDVKPFHPHLTRARWRDSRPADRRTVETLSAPGRLHKTQGQDHVARMRVTKVSLYESRAAAGPGTSGAGPTYTALVHAPLAC